MQRQRILHRTLEVAWNRIDQDQHGRDLRRYNERAICRSMEGKKFSGLKGRTITLEPKRSYGTAVLGDGRYKNLSVNSGEKGKLAFLDLREPRVKNQIIFCRCKKEK